MQALVQGREIEELLSLAKKLLLCRHHLKLSSVPGAVRILFC